MAFMSGPPLIVEEHQVKLSVFELKLLEITSSNVVLELMLAKVLIMSLDD